VLASCKEIDEVIVVDDCSQDGTRDILLDLKRRQRGKHKRNGKLKILMNARNLGKGGAVVEGLKLAKGDTILLCDADLETLTKGHVRSLIQTFKAEKLDMVIAARENYQTLSERLQGDISGERILHRPPIQDFIKLIKRSGNGMEQIINYAHRGKKVKVIVSKNIGHQHKRDRSRFPVWVWEYGKELAQLSGTEMKLRKVSLLRRASLRE